MKPSMLIILLGFLQACSTTETHTPSAVRTTLRLYDVQDRVAMAGDWPGSGVVFLPGAGVGDSISEEEYSRMIRNALYPETWEEKRRQGWRIDFQNGLIIARGPEQLHSKVRAYIATLKLAPQ